MVGKKWTIFQNFVTLRERRSIRQNFSVLYLTCIWNVATFRYSLNKFGETILHESNVNDELQQS